MKKDFCALVRFRRGSLAVLAVLLVCVVSFTTPLRALPATVTVTTATQLEVMRGTQVSMRVPLAVGTNLDVIDFAGDYLTVRYRLTQGRILAKATDLPADAIASAAPAAAVPEAPPPRRPSAPAPPPQVEKRATPVKVAPVQKTTPPVMHEDPPAASSGKEAVVVAVGFLLGCLVMMIANWRIFTKAGKPGWAGLIPIYNVIVILQIAGKPVWWILLWFVPMVNLVIAVLTMFGLAENFGKGKGFALGLMVLPFFFLPMLAFGDAQYTGS